MTITIESQRLLQLLAFMSPAFPIGSFAYSHGMEWAIDSGQINTADDVRMWIEALLVNGSGWNDAVLFAAAFDANEEKSKDIDELAIALAASRERALETSDLGKSFSSAAGVLMLKTTAMQSYPVVVAVTCRETGISKHQGLLAFLQAFSNNLIAVGLRLVPLGQTSGLEIMRELMPVITRTAMRAASSTLDDLGSSAFQSDIASMKHESQYSRVFRS